MFLKVSPEIASVLLKHEGINQVLKLVADRRLVSLKEVCNELNLGVKTAWLVLHGLHKTGHLTRRGRLFEATTMLREGAVLLNLRDSESDFLYKNKGIRPVAFYFLHETTKMADVARVTGIPYPTIIRGVRVLEKAGVLCDGKIPQHFLYTPPDPLEYIPRDATRAAVEYFIHSLQTFRSEPIPVIFYGDASWGRPSSTLNFMVLLKPAEGAQAMFQAMCDALKAAENVTAHYGVNVELTATTEDAWLMHQLKIAIITHPILQEATFGIRIGTLPQKEEFFSLMQLTHPWPAEKIKIAVERGRLAKVGDKYAFTQKGIDFMRKGSPPLIEVPFPLGEKQIRLITISPHQQSLL